MCWQFARAFGPVHARKQNLEHGVKGGQVMTT
jgi:hypothetical protein